MHTYLICFTAALPFERGEFIGDVQLSYALPLAAEDMEGVKDTITNAMTDIRAGRPRITSIWKFER